MCCEKIVTIFMASVYESKENFSRKKIIIAGRKGARGTEASSIDI